jgi:hypothetical protein
MNTIDLQQRLNKSRQGGPIFHYSIIPGGLQRELPQKTL